MSAAPSVHTDAQQPACLPAASLTPARPFPIRTVLSAAVEALVARLAAQSSPMSEVPADFDPCAPTLENCHMVDLSKWRVGQDWPEVVGAVEAGKVVGFHGLEGVVQPFAVGRHEGLHLAFNEAGERANFADLEAAVRHGLTTWEAAL